MMLSMMMMIMISYDISYLATVDGLREVFGESPIMIIVKVTQEVGSAVGDDSVSECINGERHPCRMESNNKWLI